MVKHKHEWHVARFTKSPGLIQIEEGVMMLAPHCVDWICRCGEFQSSEYQVKPRVATEFIMPEASPPEATQTNQIGINNVKEGS